MTDLIRISPEALLVGAARHEEVADVIAASRRAGTDIATALRSYGPIMHQTKVAAASLLELRDAELVAHGTRHRDAADTLRRAAADFTATEHLNAERLRLE
jgi:hypothetical protein